MGRLLAFHFDDRRFDDRLFDDRLFDNRLFDDRLFDNGLFDDGRLLHDGILDKGHDVDRLSDEWRHLHRRSDGLLDD